MVFYLGGSCRILYWMRFQPAALAFTRPGSKEENGIQLYRTLLLVVVVLFLFFFNDVYGRCPLGLCHGVRVFLRWRSLRCFFTLIPQYHSSNRRRSSCETSGLFWSWRSSLSSRLTGANLSLLPLHPPGRPACLHLCLFQGLYGGRRVQHALIGRCELFWI